MSRTYGSGVFVGRVSESWDRQRETDGSKIELCAGVVRTGVRTSPGRLSDRSSGSKELNSCVVRV